MMDRVNYIILVFFTVWIMPLGAFINPADREKACGGQRAICLCLKEFAKKTGASPKFLVTSSPSTAKQPPAGGANHHFLFETVANDPALPSVRYWQPALAIHTILVSRITEPVPKA